ncbi:MAG: carboxypeptidase-like regulatory domain-containing protein [Bacteroidota bacterium]
MRPLHCFFFCFFLFLNPLEAQEEFVYGKLLDARTEEPVVFATIRIKGKDKGVVSNKDGGFRIPIRFKELGDSLVISSMGYQKKEISLGKLLPRHLNIIKMLPGTFHLDEAVIQARKGKALSARAVVKRAIEAIPRNFPQKMFSLVGYYRDYQLDENRDYVNLNEGMLEVFDQGMDQLDYATSKVLIYSLRQNQDFSRDTVALRPYDYKRYLKIIDHGYLYGYGGNEFAILRVHDAIRNRNIGSYDFVGKFAKGFIRSHKFIQYPDTYVDGTRLYTISIRKELESYKVEGKLYISYTDFAIHKMAYTLYAVIDGRWSNGTSEKNNVKKLVFDTTCEYKKVEDKMYLNYISFNNSFKAFDRARFRVNQVNLFPDDEYFIVHFNKEPLTLDAMKTRMYTIKFRGKRVRLEMALVRGRQVFLHPKLHNDKRKKFFSDLKKEIKGDQISGKKFSIQFGPIRDTEGNELGKGVYKDYNQFREFFVQQVSPRATPPVDIEFMDKTRPIFKEQPISKPDDFEDYWMNTPLKETTE